MVSRILPRAATPHFQPSRCGLRSNDFSRWPTSLFLLAFACFYGKQCTVPGTLECHCATHLPPVSSMFPSRLEFRGHGVQHGYPIQDSTKKPQRATAVRMTYTARNDTHGHVLEVPR